VRARRHLGTPMWEARQPVPSLPFFRACAPCNSGDKKGSRREHRRRSAQYRHLVTLGHFSEPGPRLELQTKKMVSG
jgi:hypothetical protein